MDVGANLCVRPNLGLSKKSGQTHGSAPTIFSSPFQGVGQGEVITLDLCVGRFFVDKPLGQNYVLFLQRTEKNVRDKPGRYLLSLAL